MPLQARNIRIATTPVTVLTTDFATIFENDNPRGKLFQFSLIHITNVSAGPVIVSVCYVPEAGTPSESNAALWEFTIPANDFIEFGDGESLSSGATVQAKANAGTSANIKISGKYDYNL